MALVATPKQLLQTATIRFQLVFAGISALLVAVWGVLKFYPDVATKWAAYLGLPDTTPSDVAQQLLVASLIVNVSTPIITTIARGWKQKLSWTEAQAAVAKDGQ